MTVLMTEQETAKFLKISPSTLQMWRHRKTGPPFRRLGKRLVRYDQEALEKYVAEQHGEAA